MGASGGCCSRRNDIAPIRDIDQYAPMEPKKEEERTVAKQEQDGIFVDKPFTLEPSVFGSLALACAKVNFNATHITFAAILVMITLMSQGTITFVMVRVIASDEYAGKVSPINAFTVWSYEYHNQAPWACNGTDFSFAEAKIDELKKYVQRFTTKKYDGNDLFDLDIPRGTLFGFLALFYWAAAVITGLRGIASFAMILFINDAGSALNRDDIMNLRKVGLDTEWGMKVKVMVVVVSISRVVILLGLGYYGAIFLCYTDNLKDFILNSVALGFVIDAPTMMYNAFASNIDKEDLGEFEKVTIHAKVPKIAWEWSGSLSMFSAWVIVVIPFYTTLFPFSKDLDEKVLTNMCRGSPSVLNGIYGKFK